MEEGRSRCGPSFPAILSLRSPSIAAEGLREAARPNRSGIRSWSVTRDDTDDRRDAAASTGGQSRSANERYRCVPDPPHRALLVSLSSAAFDDAHVRPRRDSEPEYDDALLCS